MSILSSIMLNARINRLRKLINSCTLLEENKRDELVAFILDENKMNGIDINGSYGDLEGSLLVISCAMMDYELFEILLSKGADPNETKIDLTLDEVIYQMVIDLWFYKYLKKNKTDFNVITSKGLNPLSLAIAHAGNFKRNNENAKYLECIRIIDFLLQEKVDANLNSKGKISPLMIACRDELYEIIDKLLASGADANRVYYIAEKDKEIGCIDYIEELLADKRNEDHNYKKVLDRLRRND